ncbi:MAG: histidine phosphatase family protein [Chromatocurvus sp.]
MLISVWRHGEAAPGSPDRDRTLTARGEAEVERGARGFVLQLQRRNLPLPGRILFSRWRRTTQTAERILECCAGAEAETLDALIPERDATQVDDAVSRFEDRDSHLVLVSHQPLVTALIDRWLGTSGEVPPLVPGAYAVLSVPVVASGCAASAWWAAPPDYRV